MALNFTNDTDHDCIPDDQYSKNFSSVKLRFSPSMTILIYIIYLLPFCFGVFGNISVCLIFFQQRKLRSITNTFLMNLCLNDLIVLCVSIPMTLSAALLEHWVFGAFLCKFVNFTPTLTALVSTFTVAIIAVERWLFIVNKRKFDRRCTIVILILLWLVSILIALPEFISRHLEEFAPPPAIQYSRHNHSYLLTMNMNKPLCHTKKIYFCVLNPGLPRRIFSYVVITVQYLVPFLFVSVSCYSISRFLKRRMNQMRSYQIKPPTKRPKKSTIDEFSSYDESIINDNKSHSFIRRFRTTFQNRESIITEQRSSRSSSVVGTVLMPTVKSQTHSERRFHRSRKLLICVAALFTISWLPLTVVQIYLEHHEETIRDEPNFVYALLLIPCYLISSLSAWMNPVIYNYINRSFRREFYALYPCCFRLKSSTTLEYPRNKMTSVIVKRPQRQEFKDIEENSMVVSPPTTNRLGKHIVTFADGESHVKTAVVVIKEHV